MQPSGLRETRQSTPSSHQPAHAAEGIKQVIADEHGQEGHKQTFAGMQRPCSAGATGDEQTDRGRDGKPEGLREDNKEEDGIAVLRDCVLLAIPPSVDA